MDIPRRLYIEYRHSKYQLLVSLSIIMFVLSSTYLITCGLTDMNYYIKNRNYYYFLITLSIIAIIISYLIFHIGFWMKNTPLFEIFKNEIIVYKKPATKPLVINKKDIKSIICTDKEDSEYKDIEIIYRNNSSIKLRYSGLDPNNDFNNVVVYKN